MTEDLKHGKQGAVCKTNENVSHPKTREELEEEVARLDACCIGLNKICLSQEMDNKHLKQVIKIVAVGAVIAGTVTAFFIPTALRRGDEIKKIFRCPGLNWTSDQKAQLVEMGLNPNQLQRLNDKYAEK